ncbi:neuronal acetylcholine receptor subunit alpha-9 isoform X3 [Dermochelys coriacea]|uniref:neuronal acetylcholine receptor subunit alpha-9 isoform X3 n=1 Tax=Dermochelys coriacea TaxID=27794 RepID=UPI001CA8BA69|nr:neuronal acetylcholine receptor subunit alpha-9 isoform X3 [Dermochelys coriacea]
MKRNSLPFCCFSLWLVFTAVILQGVESAQGKYAQMLFSELFGDYSNALRPVEDTDKALNVTLQITLSQIKDMDERNQILTAYLWIRQSWYDAYLKWDKDEYDGLDSIRIPSNLVWRPDIVLYNKADDDFSEPVNTNVVLRYDGKITWDAPAITKSSCVVDVSYFPFDDQQCNLTFGSWTYNDSGEKVSLGVTVLLALTVFQLMVAESMPPSENVPLIGKYYIATMTMITASTALTIIIMNIHHCGAETQPVPQWARVVILDYMSKIFFVYDVGENCTSPQRVKAQEHKLRKDFKYQKKQERHKKVTSQLSRNRNNDSDLKKKLNGHLNNSNGIQCENAQDAVNCCSCYKVLIKNIEYIANCVRDHKASRAKGIEWKKVAKVMDRFFMWIFFIMVFFLSFLIIGKAI